jgi:transposase
MKKVSTGAAQQLSNFSRQKLTIGLDLGDRSSYYCVLDESGGLLRQQRIATTAKGLQAAFGALPRSRIALETGVHSPWVSRLLTGWGHEVIVAHARSVRLIGESRRKDDRLDAQTLARLARVDPQLLCPVKHRSAKAQADLTVIRARAGLVRARTALVNTARGLAKSYGERLRGCNVRDMNPEKAEGLSPELQAALQPLLSAIRSAASVAPTSATLLAVRRCDPLLAHNDNCCGLTPRACRPDVHSGQTAPWQAPHPLLSRQARAVFSYDRFQRWTWWYAISNLISFRSCQTQQSLPRRSPFNEPNV